MAEAGGVTPDVLGVVLCGGRGTRMGNADKGLLTLAGRPVVAHVLDRLRAQVPAVVVSANRNLPAYRRFGWPVVPDLPSCASAGPLAGIVAAARWAADASPDGAGRWLLVVPCDVPWLPLDLCARLMQGLTDAVESGNDAVASGNDAGDDVGDDAENDAPPRPLPSSCDACDTRDGLHRATLPQVAIATRAGRDHPVCALLRPGAHRAIERALMLGERRMRAVFDAIGCVRVPFDEAPDGPDPFDNLNTPADWQRAAAYLRM